MIPAETLREIEMMEPWYRVSWTIVFETSFGPVSIKDFGYYSPDYLRNTMIPWLRYQGASWYAQRV